MTNKKYQPSEEQEKIREQQREEAIKESQKRRKENQEKQDKEAKRVQNCNHEIFLFGGKKELLFKLFWDEENKKVLDSVDPKTLVNLLSKGNEVLDKISSEIWTYTFLKYSGTITEKTIRNEASLIINAFHSDKVVVHPRFAVNVILDTQMVLTEEGKQYVLENNQ